MFGDVFLRLDEWSHLNDKKWSTGDPAFILASILQTVACRGISSHPLFLSPPLPFTRPRAPLFSVFTLRSFGGASIILHSSSFWYYAGLYYQCFNVTPRKPLNKMELPNKLRWDQFLILATALMSPALTWVHLSAPEELMLHASSGYMEFGRSWGKLLSMHCTILTNI